ncbi:hypothetical protein COOONC_03996 [Cooperia oncophora]
MLRLLFALVVIGITPPGVEPSSVPVKLWMDQIVPSSSVYQSANVVCPDMPTPPHLKIEPVPKPKGHLIGKGSDLVSVEIYTSVKYFNGDYRLFIREYSELLGEFGHSLGWRNVEYHYVAYNFEIKKTICKKVLLWLQEVVNSSSFFKKFVTTGKNGLDCNYSMPAYHQHKHHRLE